MIIKEIKQKDLWESFIAKFSPQSFFQSWNWGKVAEEKDSLWRIGLFDKEKLLAIAQIQKVTAKRGVFLHLRHGPIFSNWNKEYFCLFFDSLKQMAKREKAGFIRISPLVEKTANNQQFFSSFGFRDAPIHAMDGELCWVLDLEEPPEVILAKMRKTTRYLIRQAQKLGVQIVKTEEKKDLLDFFRLYQETASRHHFVQHQGIREEFEAFLPESQILLFKGYYQKRVLASALIVFYQNQAIYHHGASIEQRIPVNYLLQWEAILEAKKRGKRIYNFWGIAEENNPRHPWRGITLFKQGFGGRKIEYLHAQDLPLSLRYCATYFIEWSRKLLKGY